MAEIRTGNTDALILCGGLGTRFRVVREDIPKALAPVQGTPFIDLLLDDLIAQGFSRIILATGHLGDQLEHYVKQRTDAEYVISKEPKTLGTGGAIKYAEKHFQSSQILVLNGDSLTDFNFLSLFEFHLQKKADMSVLLSKSTVGLDYGFVELDANHRLVSFHEKNSLTSTSYINSGIYLLNTFLISPIKLEVNYSLEKDLIPVWIQHNNIFGLTIDKPVFDIGTLERYHKFQEIVD